MGTGDTKVCYEHGTICWYICKVRRKLREFVGRYFCLLLLEVY